MQVEFTNFEFNIVFELDDNLDFKNVVSCKNSDGRRLDTPFDDKAKTQLFNFWSSNKGKEQVENLLEMKND